MAEILRDLSPTVVARAIEVNSDALWGCWHRSPRVQAREEDGLSWFESGLAGPFLNTVWRTQLAPEAADARIEAMKAHFRALRLPLSWSVTSEARPADLGQRLQAHGFTGERDVSMAVDLLALHESLSYPAGLVIEQVGDEARLRQWADACTSGFGLPALYGDGLFAIERALGFAEQGRRRMYLGLLGGQPAATAYLVLAAGVAGLYCVATLPAARRRGIGAAMTLHALRAGRALGYRVGVLGASEMGYPIYKRIGFREVETMMMTYVWDGASP